MKSCILFDTWCIEWDFEIMCFKSYNLYELKLSHVSFHNDLWNEVCSRILINFWVNCIAFYSISYSFYSQLQLICWTVESCCAKTEKHFNENWCLIFWVDFSISVLIMFNWCFDWFLNFDQYFDWFVTDALIFLTDMWAVMNNVWLRLSQSSDEWSQLTLSCILWE